MPSSPSPRAYRALARDPHVLAVVMLALDVVVVAVDRFARHLERRQVPPQRREDDVHHRVAVGRRVALRPAHRLDVVVEVLARLPRNRRDRGREGSSCRRSASRRASSMKYVPMALPMPRLPECSIAHTRPASSRQTSMKWLPPPERAHLARPVLRAREALLELRMPVQDLLQPALEGLARLRRARGPPCAGRARPERRARSGRTRASGSPRRAGPR